jgi:hypothetical protein
MDPSRLEARDVRGVHPVVDPLVHVLVTLSDRRFEIDDPCCGSHLRKFTQCVAPDVGEFDRPRQGARGPLGEFHISLRALHVGLEDAGPSRIREHLVDAPARHHVAAKKEGDGPAHDDKQLALVVNRQFNNCQIPASHDLGPAH